MLDRDADVGRGAGEPLDAHEVGVDFEGAAVGDAGRVANEDALAAGADEADERVGRAGVDGVDHATGADGFFRTATKDVVRLQTAEGPSLRLTHDHRVRRVTRQTRWSTETEWCEAGSLAAGDRVLLNNHRRELPVDFSAG